MLELGLKDPDEFDPEATWEEEKKWEEAMGKIVADCSICYDQRLAAKMKPCPEQDGDLACDSCCEPCEGCGEFYMLLAFDADDEIAYCNRCSKVCETCNVRYRNEDVFIYDNRAWCKDCNGESSALAEQAEWEDVEAHCEEEYRCQVFLPDKLRKQIEYYLSDANLKHDAFCRDKISSSEGGWISIDAIESALRIVDLYAEEEDLVYAIKTSAKLELKKEEGRYFVRRRDNRALPAWSETPRPRDKKRRREYGSYGGGYGHSAADCDELLMQGARPWDDDAGAVMGALRGHYS